VAEKYQHHHHRHQTLLSSLLLLLLLFTNHVDSVSSYTVEEVQLRSSADAEIARHASRWMSPKYKTPYTGLQDITILVDFGM